MNTNHRTKTTRKRRPNRATQRPECPAPSNTLRRRLAETALSALTSAVLREILERLF